MSSDDELTRATHNLHAARAVARATRVGAANPMDTLQTLLGAILRASEAYDRADSANNLVVLDFMREHVKTCAQWLVIAHPIPQLLDRDNETLLSPWETEQLKWGTLRALKNSSEIALRITGDISEGMSRRSPGQKRHRELAWCDIEIRGLLAQATLLMHEVSPGTFPEGVVHSLVSASIRSTLESAEFEQLPDENKAWIWGLQATSLHLQGKDGAAREATRVAESLSAKDAEAQREHVIGALYFPDSLGDWYGNIDKLLSIGDLELTGEPPLSGKRVSLVSRLDSKHTGSAIDFAERRGKPADAWPLLQCLELHNRWLYGIPQAVKEKGSVVHVISARGNSGVWAVVNPNTPDEEPWAFPLPLDARPLTAPFFRSLDSIDQVQAELDKVRKDLSSAARKIYSKTSGRVGDLRIDMVGPVAALPFHAASHGDSVLSDALDMAYLHPRWGALAPNNTDLIPSLLVLDESFGRISERVLRACERTWEKVGQQGSVLRFDSNTGGQDLSIEALLSGIEESTGWIYFGHGASHDLDAKDSQLILGPNVIIRAADIAERNFPGGFDAIIVACSGARPNLFVGNSSIGHAIALSGFSRVTSTLWPIYADHGASYLEGYLQFAAEDAGTASSNAWRTALRRDRRRNAPFVLISA